MDKQRRIKCRECPKKFSPNSRVPQHHTCSGEECQKKRRRKNQAAYRARDQESAINDRDCNRRLRERDPNYYRKWREAHPKYVERNREKQRERNRRNREAPRKKEAGQGRKEGEVQTVPTQGRPELISESKEIANVTTIPAYLVVNESFKDTFAEKGTKIANVTVIFADLNESQAERLFSG